MDAERIKKLLREATPAPWSWDSVEREVVQKYLNRRVTHCVPDEADALLISAAPDALAYLFREVESRDRMLVEIAKAVYGPDYSEPYDEPRALAGLVDAVRAGWAEKERLRGIVELYKRSDDLVMACHCDGGCGGSGGAR